MSRLHDALHKASQKPADPGQQQTVVPVPRLQYSSVWDRALIAVVFGCVLFGGFFLWRERYERIHADAGLAADMGDLNMRHSDLLRLVRNSDSYLDTRVQLEVMDLKSDFQLLEAKLAALEKNPSQGASEEALLSLRLEIKDQMGLVSKRLHRLERDHSVLSDRIEAVSPAGSATASS